MSFSLGIDMLKILFIIIIVIYLCTDHNTKLFNIIKPTDAFFGKKDAQQLIVVKKMVKDLKLMVILKSLL